MTSMTRGPQPPAVYWRRRAFVLGVVLALALIVVNVVRGPGDNPTSGGRAQQVAGDVKPSTGAPIDPAASPQTGTAAAGQGADDTTGEGKGAKGAKGENNTKKKNGKKTGPRTPAETGTPAPPPPAPVFLDPVGRCEDSDISVVPSVTGALAGRTVSIRLRLRTVENPACTWRLSSNHLALKITDGPAAADEVWASRECPGRIPKVSIVVRRDVATTYDVPWNSRLSDTGCPAQTEFAQPGEYDVSVAALGGEPAEASFDLAAPTG